MSRNIFASLAKDEDIVVFIYKFIKNVRHYVHKMALKDIMIILVKTQKILHRFYPSSSSSEILMR